MNKTKRKIIVKAMLSILVAGMVVAITPSMPVFAGWCEDAFGQNNDLCGGSDKSGGGSEDSGALSFSQYQINGAIKGVDAKGYDSALVQEDGDLRAFIVKIVNFALSFLGLIAVIIVIYGGVMYVTAGGESEKAEKGKKNVMYAVIGLIIVMGSFALVNTVIGAGGGTGGGSGTGGKSIGQRNSESFNAAAAQVSTIARKIYDGFDFMAQVTEELKGIKADIQKISLKPDELPSKIEILDYLRSAKSKVEGVKNRVGKFSKTEAYANALIRNIDSSIDAIGVLNAEDWVAPGTGDNGYDIKCLDKEDYTNNCEKPVLNKSEGCAESKDAFCERKGYKHYTINLHKAWTDIYDKFNVEGDPACSDSSADTTDEVELYTLICPVKTDFYNNLKDYGKQLQDIWKFISIVTAISGGDSKGYYNAMMLNYFGIQDANTSTTDLFSGAALIKGENLTGKVQEWTLNSSIASAGTFLLEGLKNQYKLRDEILKINFVKAVLNADITEGNAPLTVIFDVANSEDPAGGTMGSAFNNGGEQIQWDLEGKFTYNFLETQISGQNTSTQGTDVPTADDVSQQITGDVVECDYIREYADKITNSAGETIGATAEQDSATSTKLRKTSRRCTYYYPGIYNAAVKINSRDPGLYAPGMSVVTVKVNPPKTLINLTVGASGGTPQEVMWYDSATGLMTTNKREVNFTLNEASQGDGLTFKAGESKPTPQKIKWFFGDGTVQEGVDTVTHKYPVLGKYQVKLEVTNNSGITDRAVFYVNVAELVAKITPFKNKQFINVPVIFDGSGSKSDLGTLTQYKWDVSGITNSTVDWTCDPNDSGPGLKTYGCTFPSYGDYKVTLKVTNSAGVSTEPPTEMKFHVYSQLPEPVIDMETPQENEPSTIQLSAAKSYDPDQYSTNGGVTLAYKWKITKEGGQEADEGTDYNWIEQEGESGADSSISPKIKFYKKGSYEVALTVCDVKTAGQETSCSKDATQFERKTNTEIVEIKDNVDVSWGTVKAGTVPTNADKGNFALPMIFQFKSDYVGIAKGTITYELDFGDGEKKTGTYGDGKISFVKKLFAAVLLAADTEVPVIKDGFATVTHIYTKPGEFKAKLTTYDEDDNDKSISKKIFVPDGNTPYAKVKVTVNGVDLSSIPCEKNMDEFKGDTKSCYITVTRKDIITFDATDSLNKDGTAKGLRYAWDFADEYNSTEKTATHQYKVLTKPNSPNDVTLTVYDKDDPAKQSKKHIYIAVDSAFPEVSSIQALPDTLNSDQKAPLKVNLKAYGAVDKDGEIVQYRWFYYDSPENSLLKNVEEQNRKGMQLTASPEALITIGSWGGPGVKENDIKYFGFGVEVKDNDGQTTTVYVNSNSNILKVKNGANKPPVAKFTTGKTKVMVGETATFSSFSSDTDGTLKFYEWDFGDGTPTVKGEVGKGKDYPQVAHVFSKKNINGYSVTLKVIDDGGSETVSDAAIISVDSPTKPPVAAFTVKGAGKKVKFTSTSKADTGLNLVDFKWDFDINVDSDGDGVRDNDVDNVNGGEVMGVGTLTKPSQQNPEFEYANVGIYNVKLTAVDEEGNTDSVINKVTIPLGNPPIAGFTYKIVNDEIQFTDTSSAITGTMVSAWDFDANADSDGDGIKDNDIDSTDGNPDYKYIQNGIYKVKLTVTDTDGNSDDVVNNVLFEKEVPIEAVLLSIPVATYDGIVWLTGTSGMITWDFSKSLGKITSYTIDKNIYYAGDADLKFTQAGTITTSYDKTWGKTITKLTVKDDKGNSDSATLEVKFK